MKRFYKILSMVIAAAMVLGSFTVTAAADDVVATITGSTSVSGDYTDLLEAYDAAINVNEAVTITMKKDVTVDTPLYDASVAPLNTKGVTFDLNNCTITVEGGNYLLRNKTPLTITDTSTEKGGTIQSSVMTEKNGLIYHNIGKDLIINAGTFIANGQYVVNASGYKAANITINGGVFKNTEGKASVRVNTSTVTIVAGEFYGPAMGNGVVVFGDMEGDEDTHWIVTEPATPNYASIIFDGTETEYEDIASARNEIVNMTATGGVAEGKPVTLKLLKNIAVTSRINFCTGTSLTNDKVIRNITIDLNGRTVNGLSQSSGVFGVNYGSTLTIDDTSAKQTGTIKAGGGYHIYLPSSSCSIIYKNGKFVGTSNATHDGFRRLNGSYVGTLTIVGGTYDLNPSAYVDGGTIDEFVNEKDGKTYWTVTPTVVARVTAKGVTTPYYSLAEAVDAVVAAGESPATLTVMTDITMKTRLVFSSELKMSDDLTERKITLDLNGHIVDASSLASGAFGIGKGAKLTIIDSSGTNQGTLRAGGGYHIYLPSDQCQLIYKSGTFVGTTPVADGHTGFIRRNDEGQYVGTVSAIGGVFDLDPSEGEHSIVDDTTYKVEEQNEMFTVKSKYAPDVVASFNEVGYGTIGEAVAAVLNTESKSGVIILVANVTLSGKIALLDKDADIVIDLNGYTISEEEGGSTRIIEVTGGTATFVSGNIVLKNTISENGHIGVEGGVLNLSDITIKSEADVLTETKGGAIYVAPGAELNADKNTLLEDCVAKEGAVAYVDADETTKVIGKASFDGAFIDCASTDAASIAPIYSRGFAFIEGEFGSTVDVYQVSSAAKVVSASLTLESDFRFTVITQTVLSADDAALASGLNVTFDGTVATPTGTDSGNGLVTYYLDGITANKIADKIEFVVRTSEGTDISAVRTYSVLEYCANVFNRTLKTDSDNFRLLGLLANTVKYGCEVQKYWGEGKAFEVPEMFAAYISDALPVATDNIKRTTVTATDAEAYKIKGASININDRVGIFFNIFTTDALATVKVLRGGTEMGSYTVTELLAAGTDLYRLELDRLTPLEFADDFEVILYNAGGEPVHGVAYSVNSYCYAKQSSVTVRDVTLAVYRYGLTADAYKNDTEE